MFKKSLQILVAACLLALAAIVVFAALHRSGPDDALAEATRLVARRDYARAIDVLDFAEQDVANDPVRMERVLRLRYGAYKEQGNHTRALQDVERLLGMKVADADALRLDEIWLLARSGNGAAARAAAERFLADHPDHARGLELAGETCQLLYTPALVELTERLQRELPPAVRPAARAAALSFLYRPNGDPEIAAALDALAALHAKDQRLETLWRTVQAQLVSLRERVQEALGYFRRSLEAPGKPVAAFRAFALSLEQARRIDDLVIECEIQRRRFDHKFVDDAGATAAWVLLRENRPQAALATAERWLPPGTVAQRVAAKEHEAGILDLMTARAWAAHLCSDDAANARLWEDAGALARVAPPTVAWPLACIVLQIHNWNVPKDAEPQLDWALTLLANVKVPVDRLDMVPRIAGLWLELLEKRGAGDAAVQALLHRWRSLRPDTIEPLLAEADAAQAANRWSVCAKALEEARKLAPGDDALLERDLAVQRRLAKDAGDDGESLLAQCMLRNTRTPQVQHPIGFLLCGETALAHGFFPIAEACATAALEAWPQAREPRLLRVRTLVAQGRYDDALRQLQVLFDELPPTRGTVEVALAAAHAAGRDDRDLLARALTIADDSPALQEALLDAAFAEAPVTAPFFVLPAAMAADAPRALQLAAARALAIGGSTEAAGATLDRLLAAQPETTPETTGAPRGRLAAALAAYFVASAKQHGDDELLPIVQPRLLAATGLAGTDDRPLLAAARSLAVTHPRCALLLARAALACSDPAERRGADYALAGELALREGCWQAAEDAWTAALGFADGAACAEPLLRLCLAQGRLERAQQLGPFVDLPRDPAIALRLGNLSYAAALVAGDLARDHADLLAHCLLALVGQSPMVDWPRAEGAELANRADLLSLLREPALAPFARDRLEALVAAEPGSRTNRLLLARADAQAGEPDKASALHGALARERDDDPLLYREVALAARTPGYSPPPALRLAIMGAAIAGKIADSPVTLAYALEQWEAGLREHGNTDEADAIRLQLWRQAPTERTLTAADLQLISDKMPPFAAWQLLDRVLANAKVPDRGAAIDRLQELAVVCAATLPSAIGSLVAATKRYLASDGARGSLVHFLIDHANASPDAVDAPALLRLHLAAVAAGRDGDAFLGRTLQRLQELQGRDATVAAVQAQLRATPTHLGLWLERTRLLVGSSRAVRAIADLRGVLLHAVAPALQVEALAFAAEAAALGPADAAALQALPAPQRDSALGKYAAALMELRAGRADQALVALGDAPARADGMHLYALAIAALQSSAADGRARALAALQQLSRDYASSSLARNAGSFAIQLALP
jgi:hypothetical protein